MSGTRQNAGTAEFRDAPSFWETLDEIVERANKALRLAQEATRIHHRVHKLETGEPYLLRNGKRHSAPWLGFIARSAARELAGVRPVRLIDIAWIDEGDRLSPQWREVPPGHCVHGCLSDRGAYAVCDTVVATVEQKGR